MTSHPALHQLIDAARRLDAKCARREERTRLLQEAAREARRTGRPQRERAERIDREFAPTVLDISDEVAEIRAALRRLDAS